MTLEIHTGLLIVQLYLCLKISLFHDSPHVLINKDNYIQNALIGAK